MHFSFDPIYVRSEISTTMVLFRSVKLAAGNIARKPCGNVEKSSALGKEFFWKK